MAATRRPATPRTSASSLPSAATERVHTCGGSRVPRSHDSASRRSDCATRGHAASRIATTASSTALHSGSTPGRGAVHASKRPCRISRARRCSSARPGSRRAASSRAASKARSSFFSFARARRSMTRMVSRTRAVCFTNGSRENSATRRSTSSGVSSSFMSSAWRAARLIAVLASARAFASALAPAPAAVTSSSSRPSALARVKRLGARRSTRASTSRSSGVASRGTTRRASSMPSPSVSAERASHDARRTRAERTSAAAPSFSPRSIASRNPAAARASPATSRHRA